MEKRLNAKQYEAKMFDLVNSIEKLNAEVTNRLYDLCINNPEVVISYSADLEKTPIKTKSLLLKRKKEYIDSLPFKTRIYYIGVIEKWLADQHPHKQMEISFQDYYNSLTENKKTELNDLLGSSNH